MAKAPAADKLDAYGVDAVCEDIIAGTSLTAIAGNRGVALSRLLAWIDADPERSARVREARTATGKLWDERAEACIRDAVDEFDLKKARELAHHYRWRAAKIAVKEYGDKLQHSNDPDSPIQPPTFILQPVPAKPTGDE